MDESINKDNIEFDIIKEMNKTQQDIQTRKKKRKQSRIITPILLLIVLIIAGTVFLNTNVSVPASSKNYSGWQYTEVIKSFRKAGFFRVKGVAEKDLKVGVLDKAGTVDKIIIAGNTKFSEGDSFKRIASVTIYYHSFPDDKKN